MSNIGLTRDASFSDLINLTVLDASSNKFVNFPSSILSLPLHTVNLNDNPIIHLYDDGDTTFSPNIFLMMDSDIVGSHFSLPNFVSNTQLLGQLRLIGNGLH